MDQREAKRITRELTAAEQERLNKHRAQVAEELPDLAVRDQMRKDMRRGEYAKRRIASSDPRQYLVAEPDCRASGHDTGSLRRLPDRGTHIAKRRAGPVGERLGVRAQSREMRRPQLLRRPGPARRSMCRAGHVVQREGDPLAAAGVCRVQRQTQCLGHQLADTHKNLVAIGPRLVLHSMLPQWRCRRGVGRCGGENREPPSPICAKSEFC